MQSFNNAIQFVGFVPCSALVRGYVFARRLAVQPIKDSRVRPLAMSTMPASSLVLNSSFSTRREEMIATTMTRQASVHAKILTTSFRS